MDDLPGRDLRPARVDDGVGADLTGRMAAEMWNLYAHDHNAPDMPSAGPEDLDPSAGGGFWVL